MSDVRYTFVDDLDAFAQAVRRMTTGVVIAVDTESASFHRFRDRIYLLQVSTRSGDTYLIDPTAISDLAALGNVLRDPTIEKIFHDADYDLRVLRRDYAFEVKHLFDTRIAAQLLGEPSIGLAALLKRYFDVQLSKKWQRADWSVRPLPEPMLRYAASDTRYLIELRDLLAGRLDALGRRAWAAEEFSHAELAAWRVADQDTPGYLRLKGSTALNARQRAVLRALHEWRVGEADQLDRAEFRILSNETLVALARRAPRTMRELQAISSLAPSQRRRYGRSLIAAVRKGLERPAEPPISRSGIPDHRRDPAYRERLDRLRIIRNRAATSLGLEPGVLCAKQTLEAILLRAPTSHEELRGVTGVRDWQAAVLGDALLEALRSEA